MTGLDPRILVKIMPKKRKPKRSSALPLKKSKTVESRGNPLKFELERFVAGLSVDEKTNFFDDDAVNPQRRAEIWMEQADIGESCVDKYSWAVPDERAIKVLKHFSPIVEVGCGANGYWCQMMEKSGVDVVGYDASIEKGGRINSTKTGSFNARQGGPEVLSKPANSGRTLFLCYPDEDDPDVNSSDEEDKLPFSLGASCLDNYTGEYVVCVGEAFGKTLSVEQAPWGRSAAPAFQINLASDYHCILQISLPNWVHVRDTLTVWKRSQTCSIVFAAEDEDDEDEEVKYKHIPANEILPVDCAAPCLLHLLGSSTQVNEECQQVAPKTQHKTQDGKGKKRTTSSMSSGEDYECPW